MPPCIKRLLSGGCIYGLDKGAIIGSDTVRSPGCFVALACKLNQSGGAVSGCA